MNLEKPRIRAAKACKRCSQRKIKCDAVQNGLPCSRCRMDGVGDCALIMSRRGTYDRKAARQTRHKGESLVGQTQQPGPENGYNPDVEASATTPISIQESDSGPVSSGTTPTEHSSAQRWTTDFVPPPEPETPFPSLGAVASTPITSATRSVSAMFEDFISWRNERNIPQGRLILLGEPSPLTFALEEYPQGATPPLHDASDQIRDSSNLAVIQQDIHPSHLDAADIAYLKAKGGFTLPPEPLMANLVSAYLTKFHPLYSIVNRIELEKVHIERKLPWLMIHAVCFIGATFCDAAVIHQSGLKSRLDVRREYYQKAKLFFDLGYETNKIILAQCAIMLSFWGPQTHSYWNPCSWIGFGVTFAVSLGTHRSAASSNARRSDKGLLRRLWWSLVVRDTYCSVLLGRPFRINLTQCDTELLTLEDFVNETMEEGFYQIQIARLSLILRQILHCRFGPEDRNITPDEVHVEIEAWHSDLQQSLRKWPQRSAPFTCSIALEILYNYYLLLLYIQKPCPMQQDASDRQRANNTPDDIVEFRARAIASYSITLITKTKVCDLPHELFPAFFVVGIVLYRQMQQPNDLVAQLARASLDNCRIILNEAKELWDPGNWAMQIFDFLCARDTDPAPRPADSQQQNREATPTSHSNTQNLHLTAGKEQGYLQPNQDLSFGLSWDAINSQLDGGLEDYLLMPNFLPPATDEWPGLQLEA